MKDLVTLSALVVGSIGLIVAVLLINPLIIMLTWNVVMPYIFGLPTLTFGKSILVSLLCNAMFGRYTINRSEK